MLQVRFHLLFQLFGFLQICTRSTTPYWSGTVRSWNEKIQYTRLQYPGRCSSLISLASTMPVANTDRNIRPKWLRNWGKWTSFWWMRRDICPRIRYGRLFIDLLWFWNYFQILFVMGDYGMTIGGDHGGDEVDLDRGEFLLLSGSFIFYARGA